MVPIDIKEANVGDCVYALLSVQNTPVFCEITRVLESEKGISIIDARKEDSKAPLLHLGHPWCRCQDYPDSYWKWMALHNLEILSTDPDKIRIGAVWSFNLDPTELHYVVELVLQQGEWIIDSLKGVDAKLE